MIPCLILMSISKYRTRFRSKYFSTFFGNDYSVSRSKLNSTSRSKFGYRVWSGSRSMSASKNRMCSGFFGNTKDHWQWFGPRIRSGVPVLKHIRGY